MAEVGNPRVVQRASTKLNRATVRDSIQTKEQK
jgi:hypothetical protein